MEDEDDVEDVDVAGVGGGGGGGGSGSGNGGNGEGGGGGGGSGEGDGGGGSGDASSSLSSAVAGGSLSSWVLEIVGIPSVGRLHLLESPSDAFVVAGVVITAAPPLGARVYGPLALAIPVTAGGVRLAYVAPASSGSQSRRGDGGVPPEGMVVLFRTCRRGAMKPFGRAVQVECS
jgi:hypothetical protein